MKAKVNIINKQRINEFVKYCTDMNETVNAPYSIDFGFSFWVTLRREAFFGFFAY